MSSLLSSDVAQFEDDDDFIGPPPHQDDRLWRHPSEIAAMQQAAAPAPSEPALRPLRNVSRYFYSATALAALVLTGVTIGLFNDSARTSNNGQLDQLAVAEISRVSEDADAAAVTRLRADGASSWTAMVRKGVEPALPTVEVSKGNSLHLGAGVVFDEAGYIVTSADLIDSASHVIVWTEDGLRHPATVVGTDPLTDIAVISIDATNLVEAKVSNRRTPQPGQSGLIIDVNTPDQLFVGHLSPGAPDIELANGNQLLGALRLELPDTPVVPGAAVFDDTGAVLGVIPMTASTAAPHLIPIDIAFRVAEEIKATGSGKHAWLGIRGEDGLSAAARRGAGVVEVVPGGPAQLAELLPDDIIIAVDDAPIASMAELANLLRSHQPGDELTVTFLRSGETHHRRVVLGLLSPN